ncbi:hypothetical protein A3D70_01005 [Candidatus Adlerbacteria bacterium RIFCSPHIGHO2_02_FULL_54_18]|uniref:Transposase IS200-like domain-containing protein n=1 Tax=Candidatus Adlerbacteria bacterium RIFCSPHIGHO2_02_FULL_54_18 TaxID=1797241 RepID=A0A1F4Y2U2_9BACT|nr:MAG: hypothetical protein A3D70_01005 [Candidatus Adlerbacteria bacterium RIFCSPHIGHO2_02_FULL_54_18]
MRVEPHTVGSIVHVVKRGARGLPIVRDTADKQRFVRLLYYANDTYHDEFWEQSTKNFDKFFRPDKWPEQDPLVKILAWTLMPNHFHLVLKETTENGIAKFMQKLCGSMTTHFNRKYKEKGSLFQGAYKGRTVDLHGDSYLRLLAVYVMLKNPFELYPGGLTKAIHSFDQAYEWTLRHPFCSSGDFLAGKLSPIGDPDIFGELFESPIEFKKFAKESLLYKLDLLTSKSDLLETGF